jgi:hypothetical protein
MGSRELDNLSREERQLVHTLYEEGYLSRNAYLQLKAKNSTIPEPKIPDEIPSDEDFYGEEGRATWHPDTEDAR